MSLINPNPFTTRPEIEGTFGVVASTHWIATAVGMATLEKGGNAFDAAVATAFTLQVVEPHLNGPGGDVPAIVYDVRRGKPEVICGQGPAPGRATIAHYRREGLDLVPGTGLLAACVPGTFETWMLMLRDYGTLALRDVLAPAIGYAQSGYPLVERASATIAAVAELFRTCWPTSAAVYLPNNAVPPIGTLFTNPTLAATYLRILNEAESAGGDRIAQIERARQSWSQGFVAQAIDNFCRTQEVMDTSGQCHRGVLTADDMARWTPRVEAPLTYDYRRYTVCKTGPWGQGPVMLQQLALLKGFDLDGLDPLSADFIHLQVECAKLAYADREAFYGDPDFVEVPTATLLSDAYNSERRKLVGDTASLELRPGSIEGFGAVIKLSRASAPAAAAGAGEPTVGRLGGTRGDTVHFDIIDYGRQHGVGHAVRRLAAIVAGHSRARLLPRHPRANVLARRRASGGAGAGQAAAHHAVADARLARRRAVSRLGHARRRSAGPMDHAVLPAPRSRQAEPARGDRRAGLALRALSVLVLAARGAPRRAGGRRPRAARRPSPSSSAAAISSKLVRIGRKAGSPPPRATAAAAAPPPIRAACRATPRGVKPRRCGGSLRPRRAT